MATITEDYVSFETAKLLKEKGFNEGCSFVVNSISKGVMPVSWPTTNSEIEDEEVSLIALPTFQMAMKWLREVHQVACFICPSIEQGFHTNKWNSYVDKLSDNFPKDPLRFVETSDSYEQACESAIKYCLEHLI